MGLTPQQRAVRQVLFPGKRGKLSADEYARFAELCARKGCALSAKTDDETDLQVCPAAGPWLPYQEQLENCLQSELLHQKLCRHVRRAVLYRP